MRASHPWIYLNPARIETAGRNIARHEWAKDIFQDLISEAEIFRNVVLQVTTRLW